MVASGWSRRGAWLRWAAFALLITVALAACGRRDEEGGGDTELDARNEATQVNTIFNASPEALASPARVDLPQDAETVTVAIKDGGIDPDTIEGHVGLPFILTVQGDGAAHMLEIRDLVAATPINPQGETLVQFTVPEGAGEQDILLDGQKVGTFQAQAAGGISEN